MLSSDISHGQVRRKESFESNIFFSDDVEKMEQNVFNENANALNWYLVKYLTVTGNVHMNDFKPIHEKLNLSKKFYFIYVGYDTLDIRNNNINKLKTFFILAVL